ncbi:7278_t:CDS:2 [Paraglomus occultum]|uniref:7278_t:CDS:1 n=1 Tax=Paraglomus occultum TaxID=144539 RepID=A0A9N8ZQX8_9GLOM|nr:7278_t:CDS:2 [Paraglomus occultum]
MFRKKSTTLFPPVPLTFQEILSDLKALQTYNHSTDNEENKVDVLEILNDGEAEETHESPETKEASDLAFLSKLKTGQASSSQELARVSALANNFIQINTTLLKAGDRLNELGEEIDSLRKDLGGIVKTIAFSDAGRGRK